ncbi:MAG: FAD binding domain-containing protein [Anaerolineales bacterium]|nr:FAD binding domain-containing protein [Anaerolineales bacterium]
MWQNYLNATTLDQALQALHEDPRARIVAGATDLILEIERGVRKDLDTLIDLTRVPGLRAIRMNEDGMIHLGPLVTHNDCAASPLIRQYGLPLALAAWRVGAPQIRNRSTIAGNIITASPANDTITPLMALGAQITLQSTRGTRTIPFAEFYAGFRRTVMEPDEILVDIAFPALQPNQRGMFVKLGLRRAQAISVVHVAMVVTVGEDSKVRAASITLGAVTPVIVHATEAEAYLTGKPLTSETIEEAAHLAQQSAKPIDDVRGSVAYRMEMVRVCTLRGLRAIMNGEEHAQIPAAPVLLRTPDGHPAPAETPAPAAPVSPSEGIRARVNGQWVETPTGHDKTLLRWLREDAGLIGTKEGCAEGECGACTVFLDGDAVMSCLVPAPRANGAEITTIEGLSQDGHLHPVQTEFIASGAVQCGYCTPGFVMSAAKLLEERPHPTQDELRQAITGNLCRCTGYYKILEAMANAAQ